MSSMLRFGVRAARVVVVVVGLRLLWVMDARRRAALNCLYARGVSSSSSFFALNSIRRVIRSTLRMQ